MALPDKGLFSAIAGKKSFRAWRDDSWRGIWSPPRQPHPHPHSANGRHGKQSLKEIAPLRLIKLSRL
ncbi:MAG TPA: hypothetical protein VK621_24735 [Bradyrhizobium sp.]|jgi:hypothetical protein|nr:hypothetical protein [Bradyrhizobium sp.]